MYSSSWWVKRIVCYPVFLWICMIWLAFCTIVDNFLRKKCVILTNCWKAFSNFLMNLWKIDHQSVIFKVIWGTEMPASSWHLTRYLKSSSHRGISNRVLSNSCLGLWAMENCFQIHNSNGLNSKSSSGSKN